MNLRKALRVGLLFLLGGAFSIQAEEKPVYSKLSPATSILLRQMRNGEANGSSSLLRGISSEENGKQFISAFVKVADDSGWEALEAAGCRIRTRLDKLATVDIPLEQVEALSELVSISYIEAARPLSLSMDSAVIRTNAVPAHVGKGLSHPYTGKGVVVGIVDTGFDFTHPTFYDASGEEYRVKYVWDQWMDKEYTTEEECLRAATETPKEMHGTHVAGIAAGSGYSSPYKGVAYESDIYLVGTTMSDAGIANGVYEIFSRAEAAGKPCVVNLSLGNHNGPHDGTDLFTSFLNEMVGPGQIIIAAAGNEQQKKIYVEKGAARDTLATFLQPVDSLAYVSIWGSDPMRTFSVSIGLYDAERQTVIDDSGFIPVDALLEDSVIIGGKYHVYYGSQFYEGNDKYNMFIEIEGQKRENEHLLVKMVSPGGEMKAWCTYASFNDLGLGDRYADGHADHSVGEPAVGTEIITVGSYDNRVNFENIEGETKYYKLVGKPEEISSFSSLGPTADGRIKPDVAAPGGMLISSFSSFYEGQGMDSLVVSSTPFKGKDYEWVCISGTSMATPFVTGSVALWLQARPDLSSEDIKEIFSRTAVRDKEMNYPGNTWGHGKIDVYNGLLDVLGVSTSTEDVSEGLPLREAVSVYADGAQGRFHLRWAEAPGSFTVHVYDLEGRHLYGERVADFQSVDYTVSLGAVSAGVYVVRIETSQGVVDRKIIL